MKTSLENKSATESEQFKLELPAELNPTPNWAVAFPKGRVALVYLYTGKKIDGEESRTYFRVWITAKNGRTTSNPRGYGNNYQEYNHVDMVKHALIDMAAAYAVKKRKRTTSETTEYDDEDDE